VIFQKNTAIIAKIILTISKKYAHFAAIRTFTQNSIDVLYVAKIDATAATKKKN
jgi:hypothetical protein